MRRGNLNAEMEYVKAGLAAPWTAAELGDAAEPGAAEPGAPPRAGHPRESSGSEFGPGGGPRKATSEMRAARLRQ